MAGGLVHSQPTLGATGANLEWPVIPAVGVVPAGMAAGRHDCAGCADCTTIPDAGNGSHRMIVSSPPGRENERHRSCCICRSNRFGRAGGFVGPARDAAARADGSESVSSSFRGTIESDGVGEHRLPIPASRSLFCSASRATSLLICFLTPTLHNKQQAPFREEQVLG